MNGTYGRQRPFKENSKENQKEIGEITRNTIRKGAWWYI